MVVDQASKRIAAEAETAALTTAIAAVNRVLAEPVHVVVQLREPAGATAGTISWSRHDWVVLTNALARPPTGQRYLCWLGTEAARRVGHMEFAGAPPTGSRPSTSGRPGRSQTTRFVVTLEPTAPRIARARPILEAALAT